MNTNAHQYDLTSDQGTDSEERRGEAPAAPQEAAPVKTGLPVTPGLLIAQPTQWEFLAAGVDSLDVGLFVDWGRSACELFEWLKREKARASGTKGVLLEGSTDCLILPSGSRTYAFHLQYLKFNLFIGERVWPIDETPNVYVSLGSELLWKSWIHQATQQAVAEVEALGGRYLSARPNRVDLCADFCIPGGLSLDLLRQTRVPVDEKFNLYEQGNDLETFYVATPKSPVRGRIYDKGKEILRGGLKLWFLDIWERETATDVWRVEFQIRRKTLGKYGINDLASLESNLPGLWHCLTEKRFSLRDRSQNPVVTRCPPLAWWQAVTDAGKTFGKRKALEKVTSHRQPDVRWYISHLAGCLVPLMARLGISDMEAALAEFSNCMRRYWARRSWKVAYAEACIRIGRDANRETASDRGVGTP